MVHIMPSFSSTSSSLAKLLARSLRGGRPIAPADDGAERIISPSPVRWVLLRSRPEQRPAQLSRVLMARGQRRLRDVAGSAARVEVNARQTARE